MHVETPLWESAPLSGALGARVLLKMEAFQPTGSFKIRGHGAACRAAVAAGARRLVCSSGGNAGRAVAHAGRVLGVPVTVVVPCTTPEPTRAAIRREGAEVREHGGVWDEAHEHASTLARSSEVAYLHPFDDPAIWSGHATLVEELVDQGPRPGAIVLSVGGGGLACGVLEGLHRVGWTDVPVLAVETEGAASFRAALEAGRVVDLPEITSLATSLGARRVTDKLLEWTECHPIASWTVGDRDAVEACLRFADDHRVLVEPACGAALAPVYGCAAALTGREPVVVIVCGGSGVSRERLAEWERATGAGGAAE